VGLRLKQNGGDEQKAKEFVTAKFYKNVPVLDTGARGATTTFVERGIGDVLVAWENEAILWRSRNRQGQFRNRRAQPSASSPSRPWRWSTRWSKSRGTQETAKAYLDYLYTPEGQEIAAKHYYRPRNPGGGEIRHTVPEAPALHHRRHLFGGWQKAQKAHFADGGSFDQIYARAAVVEPGEGPRFAEPRADCGGAHGSRGVAYNSLSSTGVLT
jgi:sulfate/thiosulfate-binding protein